MRFLLLFPLLLAGCVSASGIEVEVTNSSDEPLWADANADGPRVSLEVMAGGDWKTLVPSVAWLCSRECGAPPGQVVCADVAPEPQRVWGLLQGDVVTWESSEELWYDSADLFGDCGKRATEGQDYRASACWSLAAVDVNGVDLGAPTESGGFEDEGAEVVDPECSSVEFGLGTVPTLELGS